MGLYVMNNRELLMAMFKEVYRIGEGCPIALMAVGRESLPSPPSPPRLRREPGTHFLIGEQREFLKNPVHKPRFEPGTFGASD